MGDTSRLTDQPTTVRPQIGLGAPGSGGAREPSAPPPLPGVGVGVQVRQVVQSEALRRLGRDTLTVLVHDHVASVLRVMCLGNADAVLVLEHLAGVFRSYDVNDSTSPK